MNSLKRFSKHFIFARIIRVKKFEIRVTALTTTTGTCEFREYVRENETVLKTGGRRW